MLREIGLHLPRAGGQLEKGQKCSQLLFGLFTDQALKPGHEQRIELLIALLQERRPALVQQLLSFRLHYDILKRSGRFEASRTA
jgi:hypothetical protein